MAATESPTAAAGWLPGSPSACATWLWPPLAPGPPACASSRHHAPAATSQSSRGPAGESKGQRNKWRCRGVSRGKHSSSSSSSSSDSHAQICNKETGKTAKKHMVTHTKTSPAHLLLSHGHIKRHQRLLLAVVHRSHLGARGRRRVGLRLQHGRLRAGRAGRAAEGVRRHAGSRLAGRQAG